MSGIDWPVGAMYYVPDWGFYRCEHGEWWQIVCGQWQRTPYKSPENFAWFGAAISRTIQSWNGEGVPLFGARCEYNASSDRDKGKELWCEVVIKYLSDWVIVFACTKAPAGHEASVGVELFGDITHGIEKRFRPIRTPEQIAADERHEAVMRMSDIVGDIEKVPSWTDALEALYDAGLRFSEQPK
jgi:hypothetical protein